MMDILFLLIALVASVIREVLILSQPDITVKLCISETCNIVKVRRFAKTNWK